MQNLVAQIILQQLGGQQFIGMTGSKNLLALDNGLQMDLAKNISKANKLAIILNEDNTYTMEFSSTIIKKKTFDIEIKSIAKFEHVLAWHLCERFTEVTGMAVSLTHRGPDIIEDCGFTEW